MLRSASPSSIIGTVGLGNLLEPGLDRGRPSLIRPHVTRTACNRFGRFRSVARVWS